MKNKKRTSHLYNLINNCLGYQKRDKIAVLHDNYFRALASKIRKYCFNNSIPTEITEIKYNPSEEMPSKAKEQFLSDKNNIMILAFSDNIWHTDERKKAKYTLGKRIANMLYAGEPCESYLADMVKVKRRSKKLFHYLDNNIDKLMKISSPSGTDLSVIISENTFCEDGDFSVPGTGGDFPSGEVGFGPVEGSVNGTIVYDTKIQYIGDVKDTPLKVDVMGDKVISIEGERKQGFQDILSRNPVLEFVSEISIGTNHIICTVEDPNSIIEEKNIGTFHVGNGGNQSYGNRKGPHFDGVISNPTITIENLVIMKDGNPIVF